MMLNTHEADNTREKLMKLKIEVSTQTDDHN